MTGHDFLSIGTGGKTTTNYPGEPTQAAAQGNEVTENLPGRVYYASTDQDGNFRVGNFFRIDQATGRATLDASAFDLSGLTSLRLGSIGAQLGESINEFSADGTLSGNSNTAVPTEQAVKTYVDNLAANDISFDPSVADVFTQNTVSGAMLELANNLGAGASTPVFDDSDTTLNADGLYTSAKVGDIQYSNITYANVGFSTGIYKRISSYDETVSGSTTTVNITYNADGSVASITNA